MINNTSHKKEKNRKKIKIKLPLKHEKKTKIDKTNTGMIFFSFFIKF